MLIVSSSSVEVEAWSLSWLEGAPTQRWAEVEQRLRMAVEPTNHESICLHSI
jgi:hypothetical protein